MEGEIANEQARGSGRATATVRTAVTEAIFVVVSLSATWRGSATAARTVASAPASVPWHFRLNW